jgi:uncharacterized protein
MSRYALVLLALLAPSLTSAQVAVPPFQSRVSDLTGTLTAEERGLLEKAIRTVESRNGAQLAVLLVPTTQPESIEKYSLRVAREWKLGRTNVNDGVLLLLAKNDRKLRIEVGLGLEMAISDAAATRIIDETMVPLLRQQKFHAAIHDGIVQIGALADGAGAPSWMRPSFAPAPAPSAKPAPARIGRSTGEEIARVINASTEHKFLFWIGVVASAAAAVSVAAKWNAWIGGGAFVVMFLLLTQLLYALAWREWTVSVLAAVLEGIAWVLAVSAAVAAAAWVLHRIPGFSGSGWASDSWSIGGSGSDSGGIFGGGGGSGDWGD